MKASDKRAFGELMTQAMAFYRQDVSEFALSVWWQACERFDLEQVSKALTAHAMDPERGQFAPKPADLVRQLHGTQTDRSLLAWGKLYGAAQSVGRYTSVVFDDPAIHAAVEDLGGWQKVCATTNDELPFVQKRFCDAYRAYVNRGQFAYPSRLWGEHDIENGRLGLAPKQPALIGNRTAAELVMLDGDVKRIAA